jgi:uncharacterized membrane protein
MTGKVLSALLLIMAIALLQSCYNDKEELLYPDSGRPVDCTTISAKFSTDVSPIIRNKCATSGCHDAAASGGFVFQNYTQISAAKERIKASAVVNKTMPKGGALPQSEINILKCWIEAGAPNN